jgi:hypothetical protein
MRMTLCIVPASTVCARERMIPARILSNVRAVNRSHVDIRPLEGSEPMLFRIYPDGGPIPFHRESRDLFIYHHLIERELSLWLFEYRLLRDDFRPHFRYRGWACRLSAVWRPSIVRIIICTYLSTSRLGSAILAGPLYAVASVPLT